MDTLCIEGKLINDRDDNRRTLEFIKLINDYGDKRRT